MNVGNEWERKYTREDENRLRRKAWKELEEKRKRKKNEPVIFFLSCLLERKNGGKEGEMRSETPKAI